MVKHISLKFENMFNVIMETKFKKAIVYFWCNELFYSLTALIMFIIGLSMRAPSLIAAALLWYLVIELISWYMRKQI